MDYKEFERFCTETGRDYRQYCNVYLFLEFAEWVQERSKLDYTKGFLTGLNAAAEKSIEWGDVCSGGSGREIVPSGPNKGQFYGQAYYNLAESILKIQVPKVD